MNKIRSDQDYANDLLLSEKMLCNIYATAASEAATDSIRTSLKDILGSQLDIQNQVLKTMARHGWYLADPADGIKVQQAKTIYGTFTL